MSGTATPRIAYQPALDGVRALAVAAVLAFHGGVAALPGGFLVTWDAGGVRVRSDGLHFTPEGVQQWIAPWLLPQLYRLAVQGA